MEHTSVTKAINAFTKKYNIEKKDRILVAFSGGKDSLALLIGFISLEFDVVPIYINHRLRKESELENEISLNISNCRKLGVALDIIDLKKNTVYEVEKQRDRGIEDSARYLRYKALSDAMKKHQCKYLATAHTLSDFRETILLRLKRKESLLSLKSIQAIKGNIIRPLLSLESEEIIKSIKGFIPTFDTSNNSLSYTRNDIRHKLANNQLCWPLMDKQLVALSLRAQQHQLKIDEELSYITKQVRDNSIKISELKECCTATRLKFYQDRIKSLNLSLMITTNNLLYIDSLLNHENKVETHYYLFYSKSGNLNWLQNKEIEINYFFSLVDRPNILLYDNIRLNISKYSSEETTDVYLDKKISPLIARSYLIGDKIELENKTVLVSKLLKDQKILKHDRNKAVLLCCKDKIAAIIVSHLGGKNRVAKSFKCSSVLESNNFNRYSIIKEK